ncbi:hypothetical protein DPMN_060928 [Dreissena polymorpha]|uniref:Uncharacterized protein n=1 Tax=Dreissena polymorpha TaxID=45954 RepID=A0A9D4HHY3_DREPO|nr:hypothetical protein DPMN_060928 [Dreissena polymorpha]
MKFAVYLLVLLPMVYCANIEERFIVGILQLHPVCDVTKLLQSSLGSDSTVAACEAACPGPLSAVPCKELQHLALGR